MILTSIDVETGGLDHKRHSLIEIGIVVDNLSLPFSPLHIRGARILIVKDTYTMSPMASLMHRSLMSEIQTLLIAPEALMPDEIFLYGNLPGLINSWKEVWERVTYHLGVDKLNIAGKNFASFDLPFLNHQAMFTHHVPYRHRILDIGSLFADPTKECLPNLEECLRHSKMVPTNLHSAMGDAIDVLRAARYALREETVTSDEYKECVFPSLSTSNAVPE